jgi:hypothetical protein
MANPLSHVNYVYAFIRKGVHFTDWPRKLYRIPWFFYRIPLFKYVVPVNPEAVPRGVGYYRSNDWRQPEAVKLGPYTMHVDYIAYHM